MSDPSPKLPFEVSEQELVERLDSFVEPTMATLSSFYLELPRGDNFLEYDGFHEAYEVLRVATDNFKTLHTPAIVDCIRYDPRVFVVLRCIVGVSPPDLADMATEMTGVEVTQGNARTLDQQSRRGAQLFTARTDTRTNQRIEVMIHAACQAIQAYRAPAPESLLIHRLEKIDTRGGLSTLEAVANDGVPYSALLYERMLGRPFASHRDSVSELVGDTVEAAVLKALSDAHVPYYKTSRAETVPGFDQAPDFLIPNKDDPKAIIEAKLTQDDGTARDKITRVQHLRRLSDEGGGFEVIACIDGRGFRIRRTDMAKLIIATRGKVFTLATMSQLVKQTSLRDFAS